MAVSSICSVCGEPFKHRKNKFYCSPRCRYRAWADAAPQAEPCVYCGIPASTIDHVPPQSVRPSLVELGLTNRFPFLEVSACRECNSLLGARALWTIAVRKAFIKKALRRRYKRFLAIPAWSDRELSQLSQSLQAHVINGCIMADLVRKRLSW
jgi:hypothetical protein